MNLAENFWLRSLKAHGDRYIEKFVRKLFDWKFDVLKTNPHRKYGSAAELGPSAARRLSTALHIAGRSNLAIFEEKIFRNNEIFASAIYSDAVQCCDRKIHRKNSACWLNVVKDVSIFNHTKYAKY